MKADQEVPLLSETAHTMSLLPLWALLKKPKTLSPAGTALLK